MVALNSSLSYPKPWLTAAEAFKILDYKRPAELVKGEIVYMDWTGVNHGKIVGRLFTQLYLFVEEQQLGAVFTADTGFVLARNPDTVRVPDVAFVTQEKYQHVAPAESGAVPMPPDLAIEVVSPNDTMKAVREKVKEYLEADVKEVWVVEPWAETVTKCIGSLTHTQVFGIADVLDGGELLPGFALRVVNLFKL